MRKLILSVLLMTLGGMAIADTLTPSKVTLVDAPDYIPAVAALYAEGNGNYLQGNQVYKFEFDTVNSCNLTIIGFLGTNGEANNRPEYARLPNKQWSTTNWPTIHGLFQGGSNPYSSIPSGAYAYKVTHPAPHVTGNVVYVRGLDVGVQTVECVEVIPPPAVCQ